MSSLQVFAQDGIEILINQETGESFCSVSGYARMAGKDKSTISRRLESVASNDRKTAEILTDAGMRSVVLVSEDLIAEWLPKDNHQMASKLMKLGVRMFLHQFAGYEHRIGRQKEQLPSRVLAVETARSIREITDSLEDNPRLAQLLTDIAMNDALALIGGSSTNPHPLRGVAEIAQDMGYLVTTSNRIRLGKFVRSQLNTGVQEKRLCNGTQRQIWCYPDCPETREIIRQFFE